MDVPTRQANPAVIAAASSVLVFGLLGAGSGFQNGDAAVYAWQGAHGVFAERVVHVGWVATAWLISRLIGDHVAAGLDVLTTAAAIVVVLGTSRFAGSIGGSRALSAWGAAAVVLPLASFSEVDLPWVALVVLAAVVPGRVGAALCAGVAALVSPVALLALPWISVARAMVRGHHEAHDVLLPMARTELRSVALVVAAVVAVVSVASGGSWWVGDRGVLSGPHLAPDRTLSAWAIGAAPAGLAAAAAIGALRSHKGGLLLVSTAFLLVAPSDVPAWVPAGLSLAVIGSFAPSLAGLGRLVAWTGVALAFLLSIGRWDQTRVRILSEERAIRSVVAALGDDDLVVAPWSYGVRTSLVATGDPYGLAWRTPGAPVRDQAERTCNAVYDRIVILPPGSVVPGVPQWTVDAGGVHWADGATFPYGALPGCR